MDSIKQFLNSGAGLEMREYLTLKLNELKNIDSVSEKDVASQQVLELKASKRAYKKLKEILSDIMTFSESVKLKDARDRFDVGLEDEV
jgi:hypothetical protein